MTGYYIFARSWIGFHPDFPFFEDVNALPDESIHPKLEELARDYLRQHRGAAREQLRQRKEKLALRRTQVLYKPNPVNPLDEQGMYRRSHLEGQDWDTLKNLAKSVNVKSRGTKAALINDMVDAVRQPPSIYSKDDPRIKKRPGSPKPTHGCWIFHLFGWLMPDIKRFSKFSPSPRMFLLKVENRDDADQVVAAAQNYFNDSFSQRSFVVRFGHVSTDDLGVPETVKIDLKIENLPKKNAPDRQDKLHLDVLGEFKRVVEKVNPNRPAVGPPAPDSGDAATDAASETDQQAGANVVTQEPPSDAPKAHPITTKKVLEMLGDAKIGAVSEIDAREWCKAHGIRSYTRSDWESKTGLHPPPARGNPRYYNTSDVVKAISEEKARSETAEETLAERAATRQQVFKSNHSD